MESDFGDARAFAENFPLVTPERAKWQLFMDAFCFRSLSPKCLVGRGRVGSIAASLRARAGSVDGVREIEG